MNGRSLVAIAIAVMVVACTVSVVYVSQDNSHKDEQHPVVEQFLDICSVPRCSGYDEKIGAYLMDFAASHDLEAQMDPSGNVMIIHPGTDDTGIILQAHQDMVPAVNDGVVHDFTEDPIEYVIKDGMITAKGTSLGADDGTGIAICLCALKDPSLKHKGFKCIFTVDEETTMKGAKNIDSSWLSDSKYLINIDDETSNEIVIGSAGSVYVDGTCVLSSGSDVQCYTLNITGLFGGHSGTDIDKGRANAIILAAEFLNGVEGVRISSIGGGSAYNAIPASCSVTFACSSTFDIDKAFTDFFDSSKTKYQSTDPDMKMTLTDAGIINAYDPVSSKTLVDCILLAPKGVLKSTQSGVITSSNLGKISSENNTVKCSFMIRSAEEPELDSYADDTADIFTEAGGSAQIGGKICGWLENGSTALIDKAKSVMSEVFGYASTVYVIHAGLECGELKNKVPSILAISIGPTVKNPHSTSEYTEIASIEKTWDAVYRIILEGIGSP